MAENLKWPREHWTLLLQSVVFAKAREVNSQLSLEQSPCYDQVKEPILKAYELFPEAYRQRFRDCKEEHDQTHVKFARTIEQVFDRWCSSKIVGSDHAKLQQPMLVEEFKWYTNSNVMAFLNENEVENLDLAARLADDYSLTHKASFASKPFPRETFNPQLKFTPQSRPFSPQSKPYSLSQVQNPIPVIHMIFPVIHLLQHLNFLVKTKAKVVYHSQFAIIVNNLAISYQNV